MGRGDIPPALWTNKLLRLPVALSAVYEAQLNKHGWCEEHHKGSIAGGSIGGALDEEARLHYVHRFCNSAVRAQFVCADPMDELPDIRDMVLDQFADGRIFILDLACGHGAGTLALLGFLAELRANRIIPTLPLNVYIFALDFSPFALERYQQTLDDLMPWLTKHGVLVQLTAIVCDLSVPGEVDQELDAIFAEGASLKVKRYFCIVSTIAGTPPAVLEAINESFKVVATRLSHRPHTWLWIEPSNKNGLLTKAFAALSWFLQKMGWAQFKTHVLAVDSNPVAVGHPKVREFSWLDPLRAMTVKSWVIAVISKNK